MRIEDDDQLLHVHRYIHLNPYVSYVVKDIKELEEYKYSSFPEYLNREKNEICDKPIILSHFPTIKQYKKIITDQADYQRELGQIKHLVME